MALSASPASSSSSLLHELESFLDAATFDYQTKDFDAAWNIQQQEEVDPELCDLFPELMSQNNVTNSDHDYVVSSSTSAPAMETNKEHNTDSSSLLASDPVLTSAIDAPPATGLGLTLPQFDFNLYDIDEDTGSPAQQDDDDVVMYSDSEEEEEKEEEKVVAAPKDVIIVKTGSDNVRSAPAKKRRKPKANAWSREVQPKVSAAVAKIGAKGRPRLYDQKPFADPELERCRLNAICAKQNRDRKRQEKQNMEKEVVELRSENKKLKRQAESSAKRLKSAEEQLGRMREMLRTHGVEALLEMVKCEGRHADTPRARAQCGACSLGNNDNSRAARQK